METVLLKGYLGNLNKDMDQILGEVGVPYALSLFLGYLRDKDVRRKWDIPWLLDEAFFWGDVERYSFIRKMYAHQREFKDEGFKNAMETLLGESNLNFFFTQGSTEDKVYEHGLEQQLFIETERKSRGRHYTVVYRDNIFLGVIAYSKNLVSHYNDHDPPVPLLTYAIVSKADRLFLGGCSMIRNSMAVEIFEMKQSGVDLSLFLSKEAY